MKRSIQASLGLGFLAIQTVWALPASADTPATPKFGTWGFAVSGEDPSVRPGDNFFDYANGTFVRNLQIPPDRKTWGNFNILADLSQQRIHAILEELAAKASAAPKSNEAKAGAFYKSFMDEKTVEALGAKPLQQDLEIIRAVKSRKDLAALMGQAPAGFQASLIDLSISPDAKDPRKYSIYLGQSGLGLPDKDYYLKPEFADKKKKYQAFVQQMLTMAGWQDAAKNAAAIVDFETGIAQVSWSRAERRDAEKTYNPMSVAALKQAAPQFDWDAFFGAAKLGAPDQIVVQEKSAVLAIPALASKVPLDTLKAWAAFHLTKQAAHFMSQSFVTADFDFIDKTLGGQPQIEPRWKRAVETIDGEMGFAVGQAYVAKYYPPEAKAKMDQLTTDLRNAFQARLKKLDWMSDATKKEAFKKLDSFVFQVGYPKKWRDYSSYAIRADDLYGNAERGIAFEWNFWLGHLGKPVDRDEWEMNPQTVNAYNEPVFNEVVFPAAILQPPFFDPHADPAVNYGGIGGVIGHEMTHSFDDQGRKFDAEGRLHDWWTKEDAARFDAKAAKFGAQYSAMEPLHGIHINGALTMGENIADLGGLTLALDAYHASLHGKPAPVIGGYTGDQRVFLGWAQVWRGKYREDALRQRLVVDPHSPPEARVNGPTHNIDAWYDAFAVKPGEKFYLAPSERVKIW